MKAWDIAGSRPGDGRGRNVMKRTAALAIAVALAGGTLMARDAHVRPLVSKDLDGVPGRELSMFTVEYPPGGSTPAHTHHAQALL